MLNTASHGQEFIPNRSRKNMRILYGILTGCMIFGFIMFISGAAGYFSTDRAPDTLGAGAALFGISLGFLLIAHFLTVPFNVHYYVGKDGITLQAFKTVKQIPYSEIQSVTALEEKQSEKFVLELQHTLVEKQREQLSGVIDNPASLNPFQPILNAFKEQKRAFEKYKFLSVAIAYSSSGKSRGPVKASGADLPCPTVFVLLKSGECFFISPLDTEGFVREAKKFLAPIVPPASSGH